MVESPAKNEDVAHPSARRPALVERLLSLQVKATVLVVGVTLAVTAAVSGYLLRASMKLTQSQNEQQAVQMAALLAEAAHEAYEKGAIESLSMLAAETANGTPFEYAIFLDANGRRLAAAGAPLAHALDSASPVSADKMVSGRPVYRVDPVSGSTYMEVSYPVTRRATPGPHASTGEVTLLGYVHTGMIADRWHRSMLSELDWVTGVGCLAIGAAIPLGFLVTRRIVAPIEELAGTMREFSEGKLNVRSAVTRRDEIGRLAVAFNSMADQHQRTHERIVQLNADLEARVAKRTHQLRELAARDPLTGLYNRRHFKEVLDRSFSQARRYDSELACIMIDLDEFKGVNDRFGHQAGDELLMLAASTITSQLRSADVVSRFGGDEFIILLPQTDLDRARVLARRIVEQFTSNLAHAHPDVQVTMSVGLTSLCAQGAVDAESFILAADRAMYEAKAAGRNVVVALPHKSVTASTGST